MPELSAATDSSRSEAPAATDSAERPGTGSITPTPGRSTPAGTTARVPDFVPVDWAPAGGDRDLALDLIRGLAMAILVLNHTAVVSALEHAGASVLSAAEMLVGVSGVIVGIVYFVFRRYRATLARALSPALLPLGQNSFYVFIVHAFLCLAIASIPLLDGHGLGLIGNSLIELAGLLLIWLMVKQRFLYRWIPR